MELVAQQCGYARFAYNHVLADFKSELDKDNFLLASELNKRFNVSIDRDVNAVINLRNLAAGHAESINACR